MIGIRLGMQLAVLSTSFATVQPGAIAAQLSTDRVLACDGAFAKDSSHARLVDVFGASNVAFIDIEDEGGATVKASVVYPDEPRRRVEVLWHDAKARRRPARIDVGFKSSWHTVRGLHIGSELAEVEKINGKPFELTGFDWELGGRVSSWDGGALGKIAGGCNLRFGFNPWADAPDAARDKVSGNQEFSSTDPNMRASKPTISEIMLTYPE